MTHSVIDTPIEYLKGVGPERGKLLRSELGIATFNDLLRFFPFRYIDRSKFYKVVEITEDMPYVQLQGKIVSKELVGQGRGQRLVATFSDGSGILELVWFAGVKWMNKAIALNKEYVVFGKPSVFNRKFNITHPELDEVSDDNLKLQMSLQPVYHTTEKLKNIGLESRPISKLLLHLLPQVENLIQEVLPPEIISKHHLSPRSKAFREVHIPTDAELLRQARYRLKFEELFFIQLRLLKNKVMMQRKLNGFVFGEIGEYFHSFFQDYLPFELTGAQKRVLREIRVDVGSGRQMNRLLQGDVGSGKTLVALMSLLMAIDNGYQGCIMVPTEILAIQHFNSISKLLNGMPLKAGLLTGSTKAAERRRLNELLMSGEMHILIGTHALIEDKVQFKHLGMAVIDEQHRFGVEQRAKLWKKSERPPHVLVMTATPIPRTLAMTLYGDLDVSVIDELPPGRKPVETVHRFDTHRLRVFGFMREQIKLGRQVYVVYPLIEESENMDYKDLTDGYESIVREFPMPEFQVSIVHGKMKADAREIEMDRFKKGITQIMVATTVIEVGVDIPNASLMVIESAERFGLSQLHQLRGRVGRGADHSYCILMTSYKLSAEAKTRIDTMVRTNDGFEISEADMRLRGPGDMAGTQQSGLPELRISDLAKDGQILQQARDAAQILMEDDPMLEKPDHLKVLEELRRNRDAAGNFLRIS